jgi:hypothetical protein
MSYDPTMHTVSEVLAYAGEHPEEANAILEAEKAGANRSTLVHNLESAAPTEEEDAAIGDGGVPLEGEEGYSPTKHTLDSGEVVDLTDGSEEYRKELIERGVI